MAWLDRDATDEEPASATPPSSRKKPPRLPGAALTLPPMPVTPSKTQRPPPRNNTMEVEMNWVELVDEAKREGAKKRVAPTPAEPPARMKTTRPAAIEDKPRARKPIRREED